jgi:hypothetical protein
MPTPETLILLNDLLVSIHRSLLQYAAEAWPWTDAHDTTVREQLNEAARKQQESIRELAVYLDRHGHTIAWGQYPVSFTSLHFVSLEFLADRIIAGQQKIVDKCKRVAEQVIDDQRAARLVDSLVQVESARLRSLQSIKAA